MPKWTVEEAREHYNIRGWGAGFFDINSKGNFIVRSNRKSAVSYTHLTLPTNREV